MATARIRQAAGLPEQGWPPGPAPYAQIPESEQKIQWVQDAEVHEHWSRDFPNLEVSGLYSAREGGDVYHYAIEDEGHELLRVRQGIEQDGKLSESDFSYDRFSMNGPPSGGTSQFEAFMADDGGVFHAGQIGRYRPRGDFLDVYSGQLPAIGARGGTIDTERNGYRLPPGYGKDTDFEAMAWGKDHETGEDAAFFLTKEDGTARLLQGPPPQAGGGDFDLTEVPGAVLELPDGGKVTDMQTTDEGLLLQTDDDGRGATWRLPWGSGGRGDIASAIETQALQPLQHGGSRSEAISTIHGWSQAAGGSPATGPSPSEPAAPSPTEGAPSPRPTVMTPAEAEQAIRDRDYERLEGYFSPENGFEDPPTIVFDFDNTLEMDDTSRAEFAEEAVQLADTMGANITIASASRYPDYLKRYLGELNPEVFDEQLLDSPMFHAGEGDDKEPMLESILLESELRNRSRRLERWPEGSPERAALENEIQGLEERRANGEPREQILASLGTTSPVVLFDDSSKNLEHANLEGVPMIDLDRDVGITEDAFIDGLRALTSASSTPASKTPSQPGSARAPQPVSGADLQDHGLGDDLIGRFVTNGDGETEYRALDRAGFERWLGEYYGTVENLNAERNPDRESAYASFEDVPLPEMRNWTVGGESGGHLAGRKAELIETARAAGATDFEIAAMLAASNIETHDMHFDPHDEFGHDKDEDSMCFSMFNTNALQMEAAGVLQRGSGSEPWVSADHPSITSDDPAMADEVGAFLQTVRAGHGEPLTDFDQLRGFLGEHRNGQSGRDRVDHAFLYAFHQGISAYLTALGDEGNDLEANNVRISTEPFGQ